MAVIKITITDETQAAGGGQGVLVQVEFDKPYLAHQPTLAQQIAMQLANTIQDINHELQSAGNGALIH